MAYGHKDRITDIEKGREEMPRKVQESKVEEGKVKQLTLRLPDDLHTKLKLKCVMEKKTMGEVLIDLIKEYVK